MATYTWTAKDRNGKSVVREISHESAESSEAALLAEGYTDLKLMEDEVMDAARAGFTEKTVFLGEVINATAEQRLQVREKPEMSFLRAIIEALLRGKMLTLALLVIAGLEYYRGNQLGAILPLIGLVLWILFVMCIYLPGIYFTKLVQADDWYRWTEVLQLVGFLEKLGTIHFIKLPKTTLVRHHAKALAGLGDLPGALAEFKACENQPGCPNWLYKAFVAGIYDIAGQHDTALEWNRASILENPRGTVYLDLANRLLRYKRDTAGARQAMAESEKFTHTDISRPFQLRCEGILAYLEGNYPLAREKLESDINLVAKAPRRPYRDGHLAIGRAYLACVSARLSDFAAAQNYLAQAREYLLATKETDLLAECEREVPRR